MDVLAIDRIWAASSTCSTGWLLVRFERRSLHLTGPPMGEIMDSIDELRALGVRVPRLLGYLFIE
jgi:hypothetical protein